VILVLGMGLESTVSEDCVSIVIIEEEKRRRQIRRMPGVWIPLPDPLEVPEVYEEEPITDPTHPRYDPNKDPDRGVWETELGPYRPDTHYSA